MRRVHLIFGVLMFAVFLYTGAYMDAQQPPVRLSDDATRMMFRSRHIYLLFAALHNVSLGIYLARAGSSWRRWLQLAGSTFIVASTLLMLAAFFYESPRANLPRFFTNPAIYLFAAGTLAHLAACVRFNGKFKA